MGLSGPERQRPASGTGPCFEINLGDGLSDGHELLNIFSCLNARNAFTPLEALAHHLAENDAFWDFLAARAGTPLDIGIADGFELMVRLLDASSEGAAAMSELYAEAYELRLIDPALAVAQQASHTMLAAHAERAPAAQGNIISLAERFVAAGLARQSWDLMRKIRRAVPEPLGRALRDAAAALLYQSSTLQRDGAGNFENDRNRLLELLRYLVGRDEAPEATPLAQLLPYLRNADLMRNIAHHLARPWRAGDVHRLPDQLQTLYTTTARGEPIAYADSSVIAEAVAAFRDNRDNLDRLLHQTFLHDDYGDPVTFLRVAFDTIRQLYVNDANIGEITNAVEEMTTALCAGPSTNELCRLMSALLDPLLAAVHVGISEVAIPLVVAVEEILGIEGTYDLALRVLDLDLIAQTEPMLIIGIDSGLLAAGLELFPLFVVPEFGSLTPLGDEGLRTLQQWLGPWNDDGRGEVVPPYALVPLTRVVLHPSNGAGDIDFLLGTVGKRLSEPSSALSSGRLVALAAALGRALRLDHARGFEIAGELLARDGLVTAALQLGADRALVHLLTPVEHRRDAAWYVYDLIDRGVLRRMLEFCARFLSVLTDHGLIDPWQHPEAGPPGQESSP